MRNLSFFSKRQLGVPGIHNLPGTGHFLNSRININYDCGIY